MKKKIIGIIIICLICNYMFSQELGEIKEGTGKRISFNRISMVIPNDWNYSVNPRALPGTDQLQLFSKDTKRTILITLTKERSDISLADAIIMGGRLMVQRATSIPEFSRCFVGGSGQNNEMWGRRGILLKYILFKDEKQNENEIMMYIYNYGESITASKEVLFIGTYIIGEEKEDTDKIIESLQILE